MTHYLIHQVLSWYSGTIFSRLLGVLNSIHYCCFVFSAWVVCGMLFWIGVLLSYICVSDSLRQLMGMVFDMRSSSIGQVQDWTMTTCDIHTFVTAISYIGDSPFHYIHLTPLQLVVGELLTSSQLHSILVSVIHSCRSCVYSIAWSRMVGGRLGYSSDQFAAGALWSYALAPRLPAGRSWRRIICWMWLLMAVLVEVSNSMGSFLSLHGAGVISKCDLPYIRVVQSFWVLET